MLAIIGPTASGKSAVGERLINDCEFSVINFDSCQFFSDTPNLVAMPKVLDHHYFYSFLSHARQESMNVFRWCGLAESLIKDFQQKNKNFVMVGGTALYLKSFIKGLDFLPEISNDVDVFVESLSVAQVRIQLNQLDVLSLDAYKDDRRLRKALKFFLSHGYSILQAYGQFKRKFLNSPLEVYALMPEKMAILNNIHIRLSESFDCMVEEVRQLSVPIPHVIGFSEIKQLLSGEMSTQCCIEAIEQRTARYAKRQVTFIKNSIPVNYQFIDATSLYAFLKQKLLDP